MNSQGKRPATAKHTALIAKIEVTISSIMSFDLFLALGNGLRKEGWAANAENLRMTTARNRTFKKDIGPNKVNRRTRAKGATMFARIKNAIRILPVSENRMYSASPCVP
jgi:hypothetical protein